MEEEIKEVTQSETEINSDVKEEPIREIKGENIYVENDPADLERMLGIAPSKSIDDEISEDNPEDTDSKKEEEKEDNIEDSNTTEDPQNLEEETDSSEEKVKPLLFSDFMEEDRDSFTYLESENGSYHVNSIPLEDKKAIRQAVKSANYIFRYPKYILKDKVLGFSVETTDKLHYDVFFPEYKLSFDVGEDYIKPYSESFKDYFEDLITRVRPDNMSLHYYENAITLTALKVIETGILEVNTDEGIKTLLLNSPNISFHRVLDYIRELSDSGEDTLTLKFLPEFFVEV